MAHLASAAPEGGQAGIRVAGFFIFGIPGEGLLAGPRKVATMVVTLLREASFSDSHAGV
ncbi:MAG: hypothetical protein Tsb0019_06300 [Roseibium sp.]